MILSELAQRLTADELNNLNLVEKNDRKPKSVIFKSVISGALSDKIEKTDVEPEVIEKPERKGSDPFL